MRKTTNLGNGWANLHVFLEKTITLSQRNVSTIFLDHENGGIDTFSIEQSQVFIRLYGKQTKKQWWQS